MNPWSFIVDSNASVSHSPNILSHQCPPQEPKVLTLTRDLHQRKTGLVLYIEQNKKTWRSHQKGVCQYEGQDPEDERCQSHPPGFLRPYRSETWSLAPPSTEPPSRFKEKAHSRPKCQRALTPKHTAAESTAGEHQPDLSSFFFADEVSFFIFFFFNFINLFSTFYNILIFLMGIHNRE